MTTFDVGSVTSDSCTRERLYFTYSMFFWCANRSTLQSLLIPINFVNRDFMVHLGPKYADKRNLFF